MPKKSQLSVVQKKLILTLASMKLSSRAIAHRIGCSHTAVNNCVKKFKSAKCLERRKGSGRARKTSTGEDRLLKRLSLKDRFKSAVDLRSEFVEACGADIGVHTVRRRLREAGLVARRPARKPLLTKKMRMRRLAWAKKYENWSETDWQKVMFSDESKFNLFGSDGIQYVRRRSGERLNENCIQRTVKHPPGQMIWGCFCYHGVGHLSFIKGTVNAQVYQKIIEDYLIPSIKKYYPRISMCIFQDDSAPCHRAKTVKEFIKSKRIRTLDWPGNSPDLNPIENLWHKMALEINSLKPSNNEKLCEVIAKVWYESLTRDYIQSLVKSMPKRIKAVIKNKGGPTKY